MGLPQPVITRQMVLAELIKVGVNRDIADDLSYRYYKNELTHKDIEYLETTFNLKLEKVQDNLNNKIDKVQDSLRAEIKASHTELDNKIDKVRDELKSDIASVNNEVALVRKDIDLMRKDIDLMRKDMEMHKIEIKSQLSDITSDLKSSFKLNCWMFGTVITLFVGTLLTLIPIVYSLLKT